jgi:hypothetical protein
MTRALAPEVAPRRNIYETSFPGIHFDDGEIYVEVFIPESNADGW